MSDGHSFHSVESLLNGLVQEYLQVAEYKASLSVFTQEVQTLGKSLVDPSNTEFGDDTSASLSHEIKEFMQSFKDGQYALFRSKWERLMPLERLRSEPTLQKLEFHLHIYFAIYPIHPNRTNPSPGSLAVSMDGFKSFLETRGAELCKTTQFLPYYALPYVPDPTTHPSFKSLFTKTWIEQVTTDFEQFIAEMLNNAKQPKLFTLYEEYLKLKHQPKVIVNQVDNKTTLLETMQLQLRETEERELEVTQRLRLLQTNYHRLIGITSDMMQALMNSSQGVPANNAELESLCDRLAAFKKSNDEMQNLVHHRAIPEPWTPTMPQSTSLISSAQPVYVKHSKPVEKVKPQKPYEAKLFHSTSSLDYVRLGNDLRQALRREPSTAASLLLALRLQLSRVASRDQRLQLLKEYIQYDLLVPFSALQDSQKDPSLQVALLQYYDTVAAHSSGRDYLVSLATSALLLESIANSLKSSLSDTPEDIVIRRSSLALLQKLSLRRKAQSEMIRNGTLQLVARVLEEHGDSLSDTSVEDAVALLMTLCLRTAGRLTVRQHAARYLKLLTDLAEHEQVQVKTYVNGALYHLLGDAAIRDEARAMGLNDMLSCWLPNADNNMMRQLEFLQTQLNLDDNEPSSDIASDDGNDDDDADADEAFQLGDDIEVISSENSELIDLRAAAERLLQLYVRPSSHKILKEEVQAAMQEQLRPVSRGARAKTPFDSLPNSRPTSSAGYATKTGSNASQQPRKVGGLASAESNDVEAFDARPRIARTPIPF